MKKILGMDKIRDELWTLLQRICCLLFDSLPCFPLSHSLFIQINSQAKAKQKWEDNLKTLL